MIQSLIKESLDAELAISSINIAGKTGLQARKHRGSFYTPSDAANALWINLLHCHGVQLEKSALRNWIKNTHFIDPACGTGIFLFSLLDLLSHVGISIEDAISDIRFTCVDNNLKACNFVEQSVDQIAASYNGGKKRSENFNIVHGDGIEFLKSFDREAGERDLVIVGNPPYVTLRSTSGHVWDNPGFRVTDLYGLFLYWSAALARKHKGTVGFIVPLSISFSNHHRELREALLEMPAKFHLVHFDNIPDSIFSTGKPDSENTNRANSQRVTFFCCSFNSAGNSRIESSRLIIWQKGQRSKVLSQIPQTFRVNPHGKGQLIPKPNSSTDINLLLNGKSKISTSIRDLVRKNGKHSVWVSSTARNYLSVGLEKFKDSGVLEFSFETKKDAQFFLSLLSSNVFLNYWKCVGDGFHVTSTNVLEFPILNLWVEREAQLCRAANRMWNKRSNYQKTKMNAGKKLISFDFTKSKEVAVIDEILLEAVPN